MQKPAFTALVNDIVDALDGALECSERTRCALLALYAGWSDADRIVASVDPDTGAPTSRRYPVTLGPSRAVGSATVPDPLPELGRRVAQAGGTAASLARVSRATQDLGQLLTNYEDGLFTSMPLREWRAEVERIYAAVEAQIMAAKHEVEVWEKAATEFAPSSRVLEGECFVFPEMLVEMLGIQIDAARKLISGGGLGRPVALGRRVAVVKEDMIAALRAAAAAAPTSPAPPAVAPASQPAPPMERLARRARGRAAARRDPFKG